MGKKLTINGRTVFEGIVTDISENRAKIKLLDGRTGILFSNDVTRGSINLRFLLKSGQMVHVRIKNRCFDGIYIFTMNGILTNTTSQFDKWEEVCGIVTTQYNSGSVVQITPTLSGTISDVYLPRNTVVLVSICWINSNTHKVGLLLNSVCYDMQPISMNIDYGPVVEVMNNSAMAA